MRNISTTKFLALLMAILMIFTISSIVVFADETEADATTAVETTVETTAAETTAETTEETKETTPSETTSEPVPTTGDTDTTTKETHWFTEHISFVIAMGIIVALVLAYFIARLVSKKFKEKSTNFWKEYNSQFKKLVWPTKEQFWKNAAVVFAAIIIFGVILALLDLGISRGVWGIKDLMDYILPAGK